MYLQSIHIIILFILSYSLSGQTCCSAGAALGNSYDILYTSKRALNFSLDYEYNSVNRLVDQGEILVNDPRSRYGQSVQLRTDFIWSRTFGMSLSVPLITQSRSTFSENQRANGIGDLSLIAQVSKKIKKNRFMKLSGGLEFPTGQVFLEDSRGIILSPDMQSGSGTWDYFARVALERSDYRNKKIVSIHSFSYRYNGFNQHFGDPTKLAGRSFKFGNEAYLTSLWSYTWNKENWSISPQSGLSLRYTTSNQEELQFSPNSGGTWLNIPISINALYNRKYAISLHGEVPAFQTLNGLQITTDYKIGMKVAYLISFKKKDDNPYQIINLDNY